LLFQCAYLTVLGLLSIHSEVLGWDSRHNFGFPGRCFYYFFLPFKRILQQQLKTNKYRLSGHSKCAFYNPKLVNEIYELVYSTKGLYIFISLLKSVDRNMLTLKNFMLFTPEGVGVMILAQE